MRDQCISRTETFLILTAMSRTQMNAALGKMEKVALEEWGIPVVDAVTRRLVNQRPQHVLKFDIILAGVNGNRLILDL